MSDELKLCPFCGGEVTNPSMEHQGVVGQTMISNDERREVEARLREALENLIRASARTAARR